MGGVNRLTDRLSSQEMEGTCSCRDAPRGQTSRGAAPRDIPVKRLAAQQKRREADASSNSTVHTSPETLSFRGGGQQEN